MECGSARPAAQRATISASPRESLRNPWSTVATYSGGGRARARAHSAASNIKATESGPPETPRTIPRAASQGLKRATMLPAETPASTDARDGVLADLAQTLRARFA